MPRKKETSEISEVISEVTEEAVEITKDTAAEEKPKRKSSSKAAKSKAEKVNDEPLPEMTEEKTSEVEQSAKTPEVDFTIEESEETPKKEPTADNEEVETEINEAGDRKKILAQKREAEKKRAADNFAKQQKRMNWEQLKSAQREKHILYAPIISVEVVNKTMVVAIVDMGGFRIVVPCSEMFEVPPIDTSTIRSIEDKIRREQQMLTKLLNAEIPFIITQITGNPASQSDYAIIASRKEAIQRVAAANYNKNHAGVSRVNERDILDATIVSVGPYAVRANVRGKDVQIPVFRLTHRYIEDARKQYFPGQVIKVAIVKLNYDANGKCTGVTVSGKIPEKDEYIPKLNKVSLGARTIGRITSIRPSRRNPAKSVVSLFLENLGIPAMATYTKIDTLEEPPVSGDRVIFSVREKIEENGIVTGSILRKA